MTRERTKVNHKFALIGSTGRVGSLVAKSYQSKLSPWAQTPMQVRSKTAVNSPTIMAWDVLDGPRPLIKWMSMNGELDTLVVLSGVTGASSTDMKLNISIASAYINAAKETGIKRILLASSSAVYGFGKDSAYSENSPCAPVNNYGKSKLEMEELAFKYCNKYLEICCLRIGNVAGADAMLSNASTGTVLSIDKFDDGRGPQRTYIGPEKLGDVLGRLATFSGKLPFTLNIGNQAPIYMEDLASAARLPWQYRPAPYSAIQRIHLDCTLLQDILCLPSIIETANDTAEDWLRTISQ